MLPLAITTALSIIKVISFWLHALLMLNCWVEQFAVLGSFRKVIFVSSLANMAMIGATSVSTTLIVFQRHTIAIVSAIDSLPRCFDYATLYAYAIFLTSMPCILLAKWFNRFNSMYHDWVQWVICVVIPVVVQVTWFSVFTIGWNASPDVVESIRFPVHNMTGMDIGLFRVRGVVALDSGKYFMGVLPALWTVITFVNLISLRFKGASKSDGIVFNKIRSELYPELNSESRRINIKILENRIAAALHMELAIVSAFSLYPFLVAIARTTLGRGLPEIGLNLSVSVQIIAFLQAFFHLGILFSVRKTRAVSSVEVAENVKTENASNSTLAI